MTKPTCCTGNCRQGRDCPESPNQSWASLRPLLVMLLASGAAIAWAVWGVAT